MRKGIYQAKEVTINVDSRFGASRYSYAFAVATCSLAVFEAQIPAEELLKTSDLSFVTNHQRTRVSA